MGGPEWELQGDPSNYFGFSEKALRNALMDEGFSEVVTLNRNIRGRRLIIKGNKP